MLTMFQWEDLTEEKLLHRARRRLDDNTKMNLRRVVVVLGIGWTLLKIQTTGAQTTILRGNAFKSPIHCCDVMKPPYLFSGELCTSPLHCKLLFLYTVCCRRTGHCFSVLRTGKSDVILTKWTAVVGEVTSPSTDTMCHSCAPVIQTNDGLM